MSRVRILAEKGYTLSRQVDWDEEDGDPINLSAYTVTCTITVGATTYNLTEGSGLTVTDNLGQIVITLTSAQTAAFTEHFGEWKLSVAVGSEPKTCLAKGLFFVSF